MRVTRGGSQAFVAEFESEDELREEHRVNLAHGALRLVTSETAPLHATLLITLRGPYGSEVFAKGTVVAALPDGIALAIEGDADARLASLLAGAPAPPTTETTTTTATAAAPGWDRLRSMSQMEKILLAVKADRSERAVMLQDNDPRVLLSLLRNPRLTVDEVVRLAKSSFLNFQIAEVIMKASQWMASLDVRLALIHNPKTPQAFGLRILPTLPESDVRAIARAGTNMALKQAALRRLQGKA
ncbi:MAG TPA: hypothetical protein VJZ00_04835 [Thermoanaerobaculia bacterium]|nr:hypothetical protein [Thermoanaerobaculia bacterium]